MRSSAKWKLDGKQCPLHRIGRVVVPSSLARRPLLVGLIGGVASGKSAVASQLAQLGALWLDSDKMAHQVLELPSVIESIRERFGNEVLNEQGSVNRKALASRVFGDLETARHARRWLEQLIHPLVRVMTEKRIAEEGPQYPVVVIDAPLLIEAGLSEICERIVLVETPLAMRQKFAAERGWTVEELTRRDRSQLAIEEKRRYATDIIENVGTIEELQCLVKKFWITVTSPDSSGEVRDAMNS